MGMKACRFHIKRVRYLLSSFRNPCKADWSGITAVKKTHLFET